MGNIITIAGHHIAMIFSLLGGTRDVQALVAYLDCYIQATMEKLLQQFHCQGSTGGH